MRVIWYFIFAFGAAFLKAEFSKKDLLYGSIERVGERTAEKPGKKSPQPEIRVRVLAGSSHLQLQGYDLTFLGNGSPFFHDRISRWDLGCLGNRIQLKLIQPPTSKSSKNFLSPLFVRSQAGQIHLNGRRYFDSFQIISKNSRCDVINKIEFEKYLKGIVNSEFSSKWNPQAVGAQVIAARTYAFFQMEVNKAKTFDVDATTKDQLYLGTSNEDSDAARVVDQTRGLILTLKGKESHSEKPLKAFYHSTCGGSTEIPQNVWGRRYDGYSKGVRCPFCSSSPTFRWQLLLTTPQIQDIVSEKNGSLRPHLSEAVRGGVLTGIQILGHDSSGRVLDLRFTWRYRSKSFSTQMKASVFRDAVGPGAFKSTSFEIFPLDSRQGWKFKGKGNGHGVGMCQWGAKIMGDRGFSYAKILKHYYPNADVTKAW